MNILYPGLPNPAFARSTSRSDRYLSCTSETRSNFTPSHMRLTRTSATHITINKSHPNIFDVHYHAFSTYKLEIALLIHAPESYNFRPDAFDRI